ncbi:sulfite exporter TauE/SafE family protein [Methylomagnum ishizawai]|uniref:urease accessory protein UreH domain-containing protein n=1 Tax=Methylomagnum ishizawai TaxID=1760988 RepID=UPI001C32BE16|nr:sulfite exporter TauE/SafE family protein [Methylomagnum ishizawai]BBL73867.1 hypothetical protein MishRS11D_09650 [Methylomagnum ishizawai]
MPTQRLTIEGMHCQGCAGIIEQAALKVAGVRLAQADYDTGTLEVLFDAARTSPALIAAAVEQAGYGCSPRQRSRPVWRNLGRLASVALALAGIGGLTTVGIDLADRFRLPQFEHGMGYGLLFLVGLFTGFHCIGMCGGFVVGYTARSAQKPGRARWLGHAAYGLGKTLSYTLIGGLFGLLGSFIAFTPMIRGYAALAAGTFLILFGINMLDWFPSLHRIGLRMPRFLARFLSIESKKHPSPFAIGLLNGLMIACGPLQAMYVMAAGTGDFLEGAKLLLAFGLGTLPVMLGFGLLAGAVSGRVTHGVLKASAFLVVALGVMMLNRGLLMTGSGYDFRSLALRAEQRFDSLPAPAAETHPEGYQAIRMEVDAQGYHPNRFVLKQGVPVRWTVVGQHITECNRRIMVPTLGLEFEVRPGDNLIEFTPERSGVIAWSCWMGMIHGSFVVVPADAPAPTTPTQPTQDTPYEHARSLFRQLLERLQQAGRP